VKIPIYQVDAFADRPFAGNPAAVCPLRRWIPDRLLQAIAAENNLSETAFFVPRGSGYHLRWFTPASEVDLCGHATLATAHVLFEVLGAKGPALRFTTQSGPLMVTREGRLLVLDFPSRPPVARPAPPALIEGLRAVPRAVLFARDYLAVFRDEAEVAALRPDFDRLREVDATGIIATAPGRRVDFVSRFFAPGEGIDEDPVTGSAHCALVPYWAARLGRRRLRARQISARGGDLRCELAGDRVRIAGRAVSFLAGTIALPAGTRGPAVRGRRASPSRSPAGRRRSRC
jgi:predicted PhzF superfamily epimerase YddE/YHI9